MQESNKPGTEGQLQCKSEDSSPAASYSEECHAEVRLSCSETDALITLLEERKEADEQDEALAQDCPFVTIDASDYIGKSKIFQALLFILKKAKQTANGSYFVILVSKNELAVLVDSLEEELLSMETLHEYQIQANELYWLSIKATCDRIEPIYHRLRLDQHELGHSSTTTVDHNNHE